MRDFILCFDSVDQAQQAGDEFAVSGSRNGMATCVIGSHQFIESGNFFSDGKFWVDGSHLCRIGTQGCC